jgi:hypothetical protein
MPYQDILVGDLLGAIDQHEIEALMHHPAGQSIAFVNRRSSVREVMERLTAEAEVALGTLRELLQ